MNATGVTAGPAESNGRLLLSKWRDSLHVTCGLTACTPGSAPVPTLGNEYGKTLPLPFTLWKFASKLFGLRKFRLRKFLLRPIDRVVNKTRRRSSLWIAPIGQSTRRCWAHIVYYTSVDSNALRPKLRHLDLLCIYCTTCNCTTLQTFVIVQRWRCCLSLPLL